VSGLAVVDLETTGLDSSRHSILQAAVVVQDWSGRVDDEWSTYVRPPSPLTCSLGPVEIHGIRRRQVLFAPNVPSVLRHLAESTAGRVLVAHNAAFDIGFLRAAAARHGVEWRWRGSLCTLALARKLGDRGRADHKLVTLCREFGIDFSRAHDALADARATGALLPLLLQRLGIETAAEAERYVRA
jgi:DNA polymerase-3 subunit epsilon